MTETTKDHKPPIGWAVGTLDDALLIDNLKITIKAAELVIAETEKMIALRNNKAYTEAMQKHIEVYKQKLKKYYKIHNDFVNYMHIKQHSTPAPMQD